MTEGQMEERDHTRLRELARKGLQLETAWEDAGGESFQDFARTCMTIAKGESKIDVDGVEDQAFRLFTDELVRRIQTASFSPEGEQGGELITVEGFAVSLAAEKLGVGCQTLIQEAKEEAREARIELTNATRLKTRAKIGDAALKDLREVMSVIQHLQPAGSPCPGGPPELARWIVESILNRVPPAHTPDLFDPEPHLEGEPEPNETRKDRMTRERNADRPVTEWTDEDRLGKMVADRLSSLIEKLEEADRVQGDRTLIAGSNPVCGVRWLLRTLRAARRLRERGEVRKALDLGRPYEIHVFPALNEESPGLRSYCRVLMNTGQEYEGCGSSVGEAVVEALADARTALDTDEPGEGEREPCIECDHPMNLHDEHVGCTVGWENLSQGCPCPQGADPAPEEEPSYRCRICGRPTDGVTICRYCDRGKRWVMQEMTDRGLADPAPEEEPEGIAELGRRLTEAFHALQNQLGEDPGPPELSDAVHTVEAVAFELTSDRPAPEDPDRGPDDVPRYLAEADDVPTEHIIGAALEDGREKGETRIELQKRVKRYLELLDRLRSRPSSFEACPSCEAVPIPEHADECPNCGYRGENEPVGQTAARPSSGDGEEVGDE